MKIGEYWLFSDAMGTTVSLPAWLQARLGRSGYRFYCRSDALLAIDAMAKAHSL